MLVEKDIMKKNEIPPTRACEGLGLPSPRDFPRAWRAAPSGNPSGKANLDPHSLVLEVYTIPNKNYNLLGLSCGKLSSALAGCLLSSSIQPILTQLAYVETAYYTQFSSKAELKL